MASDLAARSMENVWGFNGCGLWHTIVCTASCLITLCHRRFCRSWPTMRWETLFSKQLSLKCTERSKLYFEAFYTSRRSTVTKPVLFLQPYSEQYGILRHANQHTQADCGCITMCVLHLLVNWRAFDTSSVMWLLLADWSGRTHQRVDGSLRAVADFNKMFHFQIALPVSH